VDTSAFQLDIVTPRRVLFSGPVVSFSAPGTVGGFQVLHNHAPLLSLMTVGEMKLQGAGGEEQSYATTGGIVDVRDNKAVILAEAAERADQIDVDRAREALERAQKRLASRGPDLDVERARRAARRAANRIRVATKERAAP
jgi:F-type H+-transporting ATPase subunit epsilon